MSLHADHSPLCRLIDDSLLPYSDLVPGSLTPEIVEGLLISLSQVCRQIQLWTLEFDSDSDSNDETLRKLTGNNDYFVVSKSHPNDHQCLAKIVAHLMYLFGLENPYIQHLTGNTLVAISEFIMESEAGWDELVNLLCHCLKVAILNTLSSPREDITMESEGSDFDSSDSLKLKLENANYLRTASIIQVLRKILKLLKLNLNDKLLRVYLDSVTDSISNVPWDLLNASHVVSNGKDPTRSGANDMLHKDAANLLSVAIFHGNLVQLLCSLVDINGLNQKGTGLYKHRVIFEIRTLIPNILAGCIGKPEYCYDARIGQYLKHKILVVDLAVHSLRGFNPNILMMRLSLLTDLEHSVLVSWLHLIEKYFQDLLLQPIKVLEYDQDNSLEGSPFWIDVSDVETKRISLCHLQRAVVFLFLRCSLTLVGMKEKEKDKFKLASSDASLTFDLNLNSECSTRSDGLLEVQMWLQRHLPCDIFVDDEKYYARCMSFALSFLQLYMHEDDFLFEMLLQMFCMPFYSRVIGGGTSLAANDDVFRLLSDLFDPLQLFHLFLAEIHYDHQVLLDYLISKDTGARCAEYLLRCLRLLCDAWELFVEFPARGESLNQSCRKRRRILMYDVNLEDGFSTTSKNDLLPSLFGTGCEKEHQCGSKHRTTKRLSFGNARDCLFSLKSSIHSLHQKNLFPYNPQVLLKRLSRFQELSLKQVEMHSVYLNKYGMASSF